MTRGHKLEAETVTLRVALIGIGLIIAGVVLMIVGLPGDGSLPTPWWKQLASSAGSAFLVAGLLSTLWELFAKRAFARELLARVRLSTDLAQARITQVVQNFRSAELDWDAFFADTEHLDLFVTWARSWRHQHHAQLQALLQKANGRIRVLLPDPADDDTMEYLVSWFADTERDQVVGNIKDAKSFFSGLAANKHDTAEVCVYYTRVVPHVSWYRFGPRMIVALQTYRPDVPGVPALVAAQGGYLYDFFRSEFDALITDDSRTRRAE